jgi:hypothetical protein
MRRRFGKPDVFFLGFNQFVGLLFVVHPRAPAAVFTPLLKTGVPHRPTNVSGLLRQPRLGFGKFGAEPSTGLHASQSNANHRQVPATSASHGAAHARKYHALTQG